MALCELCYGGCSEHPKLVEFHLLLPNFTIPVGKSKVQNQDLSSELTPRQLILSG